MTTSLISRALSIIESAHPGIAVKEFNHVQGTKYYFTAVCGKRGYVMADNCKIILMDDGYKSLELID